ncbi:MAG TPA: dihydroorotase [Bacteroidetes bacterium]|nr:dihydroorotase [Bacteroidota bacterium]
MPSTLIRNAQIVNEGRIEEADVFIKAGRIHTIGKGLGMAADQTIDAAGQYLLPGLIDDQVHFREPGLTHKADLYTESKAAVAGGITSFMEMPNTNPQTLTQELLEKKYQLAAQKSLANYSFFMGASNNNISEVLKTDPKHVCGIKVFMGSSTGNMLVDDEAVLEGIFRESSMLVATHCEKEEIIRANIAHFTAQYGDNIPVEFHPVIRSAEACYASSSLAVRLAKQYGTRLHILHISTEKELALFQNDIPLSEKQITAEVCIHHLWFDETDYPRKGMFIKWNPAVKAVSDREALLGGLLDDRLDIIATDHAPHTLAEKDNPYTQAPSGGPLVQHALPALLDLVKQGKLTLEKVVEKACHAPATCFQVHERGYIREGYWADLVLVDLNAPFTVSKGNILYKCGWSPFEGHCFSSSITHTFVSGHLAWNKGQFDESQQGMRLRFDR